MQSPFYKLCGQAFREAKLVDGHAKYEDYVAVAELQVEPFLKDESVRAWGSCQHLVFAVFPSWP